VSDRPAAALRDQSFPELAAALRSETPRIIEAWIGEVRRAVPSAHDLTDDQIRDHQPVILPAMADALDGGIGKLVEQSPAQGVTRFGQRYDVAEVMLEDRLLRQVIVEHVGAALGRPMTDGEHIGLHAAVDVMLQQAVVAFVAHQNARLREAAEAELKYLSFLSHDLHNNLGSVTVMLQVLRQRLATSPEFAGDVETLDAAQQAILDTVGGTGRLLQSERLRKSGGAAAAERRPVDLHALLVAAARQSSRAAEAKGIKIVVDAAPGAVAASDRELIALVVQNLVGNAVKYSSAGTVCVTAVCGADGRCGVSVSDQGPGIAVEHLERIFESFRRGDPHGKPGVGLGLAIAAQAAKLLGATLTVESKVGVGSTFTLTLPAAAVDDAT
jgi:signal transduction histidine kinase